MYLILKVQILQIRYRFLYKSQAHNYQGAGKSFAQPGWEKATATKL